MTPHKTLLYGVHLHAHFTRALRPWLAAALKHLRCGYSPNWPRVELTLRYMEGLSESLRACADMNATLATVTGEPRRRYRKPRFSRHKAPPKPGAISLADQETFLEGLLRWLDAMLELADAPEGECYPHLPPGLKAVLQRNGYDPHHHRSARKLVKEYFR
jgi:hypothetical protein